MLKRIRTILAAVVFIMITLLFLDFTGTAHHWLSWMAKVQFCLPYWHSTWVSSWYSLP